MAPAKDLTGRRFGTLIANHRVDSAVMKRAWSCQCDCGVQKNIRTDALLRGATQSCGTPSRHLPVSDPSAPFFGPVISREQAIEQGLKWYVTGHPCKDGHVCERQVANYRCRQCGEKGNADRCKQWYEKQDKSQLMETAKAWAKANPKKRKQAANAYAARWRTTEAYDEWISNRKTPEGRKKRNGYALKKRHSCPQTRLKCTLRSRVYSAVKMQNAVKAAKTAELTGIHIQGLMKHLESQFSSGMDWGNMGQWHIDHIRPCASFDLTDEAQQRECFHYTNLQPLWAEDNFSKSDNWEPVAA